MKSYKDKLNKLNKPLKAYQSETAEFLKETKQPIDNWKKLLKWFPENKSVDVAGLCQIIDLEEIEKTTTRSHPGDMWVIAYKLTKILIPNPELMRYTVNE